MRLQLNTTGPKITRVSAPIGGPQVDVEGPITVVIGYYGTDHQARDGHQESIELSYTIDEWHELTRSVLAALEGRFDELMAQRAKGLSEPQA